MTTMIGRRGLDTNAAGLLTLSSAPVLCTCPLHLSLLPSRRVRVSPNDIPCGAVTGDQKLLLCAESDEELRGWKDASHSLFAAGGGTRAGPPSEPRF